MPPRRDPRPLTLDPRPLAPGNGVPRCRAHMMAPGGPLAGTPRLADGPQPESFPCTSNACSTPHGRAPTPGSPRSHAPRLTSPQMTRFARAKPDAGPIGAEHGRPGLPHRGPHDMTRTAENTARDANPPNEGVYIAARRSRRRDGAPVRSQMCAQAKPLCQKRAHKCSRPHAPGPHESGKITKNLRPPAPGRARPGKGMPGALPRLLIALAPISRIPSRSGTGRAA